MTNPCRNTNPPRRLLTLEEAEELINPFNERLAKCIQHGWDAWRSEYQHKHHILGPRARATIVFDEIVAYAEHEFTGVQGVKFVRKSNTFFLYIGDDITLRFKKIKRTGRCSNIETRQQMLFNAQVKLPFMPGTLVHAGYALDELQRQIASKLVVCQFQNQVLWTIQLTGEAGATVEVMPAPPAPAQPKPRFVAKTQTEKKRSKAAKSGTAELG